MAYSQVTIGGSDMKEQMLWLSSVFGGILICVIVYHITGAISSMCFKVYSKLHSAQKVEWNNRGFSTVHAFIVAVAASHLLLFSDLFKEDLGKGKIVDRRSTYSNTTFGISIGYFLSDLAMILWHYPALGGKEYILHHGLSLYSIILALVSGQAHMYILIVLFSEITTPFVNLRWYLDVSGEKKSKLYVYNGFALFFGWLGARIVLFIFLFKHMYDHFDQVKTVFPLGFYGLLTVPPLLALMNIFWFWKIVKGLIKTLSRARHQN
ncbi:unnamed protein product [Victoria cruziana]